ncbi:YolD-like family protein [Niallia nealsonii]|uniref:YolD-like protein n=1 Tax=Niallia nealsonii TaxID=115979 RepID=A0A2N0Z006_9BACI|nr:YolD-like family protein [Niallia nealsonii]PKG22828.1 hypothetical protein CWS01_14150 [Niallia nealsonii]
MAKTKKLQRPQRDEFELEEIANSLLEAHTEKSEVLLNVWKRDEPVKGTIVKMDGNTKLIHVENDIDCVKIPFMNILKVQII